MKCVICRHGETKKGKTTVTVQRGETTVIIKGVPADICENCGEAYLTERITERVSAVVKEAVRQGTEVQIVRFAA